MTKFGEMKCDSFVYNLQEIPRILWNSKLHCMFTRDRHWSVSIRIQSTNIAPCFL